jgi:hypothetical protein
MKKIFAILILGVALLSANAANAADWFGRWDHNHDGRWDRHEYWAAQTYWARHHAGYPVTGWGPAWNRYDINHDRYWNRNEAWRYHHW